MKREMPVVQVKKDAPVNNVKHLTTLLTIQKEQPVLAFKEVRPWA